MKKLLVLAFVILTAGSVYAQSEQKDMKNDKKMMKKEKHMHKGGHHKDAKSMDKKAEGSKMEEGKM